MVITNHKTISLRGSMYSCYPRIVWQELFNYYKDNGGDLSNLDNLLVDYNNLVTLFDTTYGNEIRTIVWGMYKSGPTTYAYTEEIYKSFDNLDEYIACRGYDLWLQIVVDIDKEEVVFKEIADV